MLLILLLHVTPFWADKVEIIKENGQKIIQLTGHVVLKDEQTKITCYEARLNETMGSIVLIDSVQINDRNGEISADTAFYLIDEKKGFLRGNVMLQTEERTISSDSLFYDGINNFVQMYKNVKIEDPKNNLISYSQVGWYNLDKEEGHLLNKPSLELLRKNREPIKIYAQEFQLVTNENKLYGFDSVIAIIDSITIYCDTFLYNLKEENGTMVKPMIIEKNNELRGAYGNFKLQDRDIESFGVENGWSRYFTDDGSMNIVEGLKINIIFQEGKVTKILVDGEPRGTLTLKKKEEKPDVND